MNATMRAFFASFGGLNARPKDEPPPKAPTPPPAPKAKPKAPPPRPLSTYVRRSRDGSTAKVVELRASGPTVIATVATDEAHRVVLPAAPPTTKRRRVVAAVTLEEASAALAEARAKPEPEKKETKKSKIVLRFEAAAALLAKAGAACVDRAELDRRIVVVATATETAARLRERGYPVLAERLEAEAPTLWHRSDPGALISVFLESAAQSDFEKRDAARYHAPKQVLRDMSSKGKGLDRDGRSMYGRVRDQSGGFAQDSMRAGGHSVALRCLAMRPNL